MDPHGLWFPVDSADGKSQEETEELRREGSKNVFTRISLGGDPSLAMCLDTEGHQATCSNQLCLIPGSIEHFFLLSETR